jgi:hypothetical protein
MNEAWRAVIGFEGLYEVSNLGRVRRIGRAAKTGAGRGGGIGRIRKLQPTPEGYLHVVLWKDGKPKARQVHGLIAEAFLGPAPPGHEPNHEDGDKHNNRASNLEWVTRPENMKHAYATGLRVVTDAQRYARRKTHCPQGHEMSGANVYWRGDHRKCRAATVSEPGRAARA